MNNVYQIITDQLLEQLDKGVIPWQKPWRTDGPAINYITRKEYTGINRLLLESGEYITFKQVQTLKGKVKKGSKAMKVVFYKPLEVKDEDEIKTVPLLRYYNVFSLDQVEEIESKIEPLEPFEHDPVENAENLISAYINREQIKFTNENANRAYYSPHEDKINVPPLQRFELCEEYYATVLHEAAHSTGHEERLNRKMGGNFGSKEYSREELAAEIAAAYLSEYVGLDIRKTIGNAAAYIANWSGKLKADPKLIVQSAAASEKICAYVLGREQTNA